MRKLVHLSFLMVIFFQCSCAKENIIQIRPETVQIKREDISDNSVMVTVFSEAIVISGSKPISSRLNMKIASSSFESWCIDTQVKLKEVSYDSGPGECAWRECFTLITEFELIFSQPLKTEYREKQINIGKLEIELQVVEKGKAVDPIKYTISLELV